MLPLIVNDIRKWICYLPEGKAEIYCGGTHVSKLSNKDLFFVKLKKEDSEFIMQTKVCLLKTRTNNL